jgi:hypothetical protein
LQQVVSSGSTDSKELEDESSFKVSPANTAEEIERSDELDNSAEFDKFKAFPELDEFKAIPFCSVVAPAISLESESEHPTQTAAIATATKNKNLFMVILLGFC